MDLKLFNRKEAAAIMGVKIGTVKMWQRRGKITPALYVNNRPRYLLSDLQKMAHKTKPALNG
jgi:predicted site-specific integrase-resolvase